MQVNTARIHSYLNNPTLIRAWRANIDIQFCGNPYGAAQYCAYYTSKDEPISLFVDSILQALRNLPSDATLSQTYRRLGSALVGSRQVSHQEAVWILLGFEYTELSRKISVVSVVPPDQRAVVLKNKDLLERGQATDVVAAGPTTQLGKLRAYMHRPPQLEDLSMFDFEQNYLYKQSAPSERR